MLKNYLSFNELVRDLRKRRKSVKSIIASDDETDDDNTPEPAPFQKFGERDASKPSITERFQKTDKASREHGREVARNSKRLHSLLDQQKAINNITYALNTEFAKADYTNLDRMRQIANRIKQDIDTTIKTTTQNLGNLAKKTAPGILFALANKVDQKIQAKIGKKAKSHETVTLTAMVDDLPQYTIYLIYHNMRSDSGFVFPTKIYALSLYKDKLYVNFREPRLKPPGHFEIGLEVPINPKALSETTNLIMKKFDTQLNADDQISGMDAMPLPMETNKIDLTGFRSVTKFTVKNNEIYVHVDKSITNEAKVNEILNNIQIYLFSAAVQGNPRTKLRITHSKARKTTGGYIATFKFIPGGKYSGITMDQEKRRALRGLDLPESAINHLAEYY